MPNSLESRITFPMGQCNAFLRDQFGLEGSVFEKTAVSRLKDSRRKSKSRTFDSPKTAH